MDSKQVEHDRLGGQQQRAERPGQQQEGDGTDGGQHHREAAVQRAGGVDGQGAAAPDPGAGQLGGGQGAKAADQRLDQHAGVGRFGGGGRAQLVEAGHLDGRAGGEGGAQAAGERPAQLRVGGVRALVGAPDERVHGAAAVDHQAAVVGGGRPGQHPQPRVGRDPGEGSVERVGDARAVDGGPLGQDDHRDQRVAGAAVAVGGQDGQVGLVALLLGQPARHHPGRGHPGDQDRQPGRDHGQPVAEQELGQAWHGSPP
jgi:hypothetical protein